MLSHSGPKARFGIAGGEDDGTASEEGGIDESGGIDVVEGEKNVKAILVSELEPGGDAISVGRETFEGQADSFGESGGAGSEKDETVAT